MEYVPADLWSQALALIVPIVFALLSALILWAVTQLSAVLKRKWGIEIDTAALQAALARAQIEKKDQETLHSAIRTGVARVIDEIEATEAQGILRLPTAARRTIVEHMRQSIPGTLAALSPMPDVIDNLAIRFAMELLAQRRANR